MANLDITFSKTDRTVLGEALQISLIELIAFGLVTKQAHWNVVGPGFRALHLHLDEIYALVEVQVDTVAERMNILSLSPNGQPSDVAKSKVKELTKGFHNYEVLATEIAQRLHDLIMTLREQMDRIEDVDAVTADMFHAIVEPLEKNLWMLRAQTL